MQFYFLNFKTRINHNVKGRGNVWMAKQKQFFSLRKNFLKSAAWKGAFHHAVKYDQSNNQSRKSTILTVRQIDRSIDWLMRVVHRYSANKFISQECPSRKPFFPPVSFIQFFSKLNQVRSSWVSCRFLWIMGFHLCLLIFGENRCHLKSRQIFQVLAVCILLFYDKK